MKLLITGGLGYLGGRLAQYLGEDSEHDIVLGSRQSGRINSGLPYVGVVQMKWESSAALEEICAGVDVIVHLAGMNAQDCINDPVAALDVNAVATARLLQSACRQGVKRFIYVSTAHVYASPLTGVITEDTCPINMHPYATSHRAGEDVVRSAHERGEIEGVVLRLSNAFGAPTRKDVNCWMLLVNDLCRQAVLHHQIILRTSGMQKRDFIPLSDVVRVISRMISLPESKFGNSLFNVGSGQSMRVMDMAEIIQHRCFEVLGHHCDINCAMPVAGEKYLDLEYRIDKLLSTGSVLTGALHLEIDACLIMCQEAWTG